MLPEVSQRQVPFSALIRSHCCMRLPNTERRSRMKQPSYREQDHNFGRAMLALRIAMGLTQADLSELLGISRYGIGDWELGNKYPKASHLKQFVVLALEKQAFPVGHEAEEIRALLDLAHQKVALDEHWLASLLSGANQVLEAEMRPFSPTTSTTPRFDWGDALTTPSF